MTDGIFLSSDLLIIPAKICRDLIKGIADVISAIKHTVAIFLILTAIFKGTDEKRMISDVSCMG